DDSWGGDAHRRQPGRRTAAASERSYGPERSVTRSSEAHCAAYARAARAAQHPATISVGPGTVGGRAWRHLTTAAAYCTGGIRPPGAGAVQRTPYSQPTAVGGRSRCTGDGAGDGRQPRDSGWLAD